MNIINFDDSFKFVFKASPLTKFEHPATDYYLCLHDLSINLLISLKWIKWGFKFSDSIVKELDNMHNYSCFEHFINESIQDIKTISINEYKKILLLDDVIIKNSEMVDNLINDFYRNECFDENTKVRFKLKLNLREYLLINDCLYPTFIQMK